MCTRERLKRPRLQVVLSAVLGFFLGHLLPLVFAWTPRPRSWPSAGASFKTLAVAVLGFALRTLFVLLQVTALSLRECS